MDKAGNIRFLNELIADIKSKKELKGLDDVFVRKNLSAFLRSAEHNQDKEKALKKLAESKTYKQFTKSREHDFLLKGVRAELRKLYGVFILDDYGKREKMLESISLCKDEECVLDMHKKILGLHKSTKERLDSYEDIYENIFSMIKDLGSEKQKYVILDIGCGLNPVSSIFYQEKIKKYYASDVADQDCAFIREYFKKMDFPSEVFTMDLTEEKEYSRLKNVKADICLLFKTLDTLERAERNITEKLLRSLDTDIVVVSFPTITIGGKNVIDTTKRGWFEAMLVKFGWEFKKFSFSNELFYVIRKI